MQFSPFYVFSNRDEKYGCRVNFIAEFENKICPDIGEYLFGNTPPKTADKEAEWFDRQIHRFWGGYSFFVKSGKKLSEVDKSYFFSKLPAPDDKVDKYMKKIKKTSIKTFISCEERKLFEKVILQQIPALISQLSFGQRFLHHPSF